MRILTLASVCLLALMPIGSAGVPQILLVFADDAGSGGDAPRDPARAVPIATDTYYTGAFQHIWATPDVLFWDLEDSYWFHAEAGDVLNARVKGAITGAWIYAPDGTELVFDTSTATVEYRGLDFVAPETGRYVLTVAGLSVPQPYCFAVGLDQKAPMQGLVDPLCFA
jgi:hypothetical protein